MQTLTEHPVDAPPPVPPVHDVLSARGRKWRPGLMTVAAAVIAVFGLTILLYPSAASWVSSYNQSKLVKNYSEQLSNVQPSAAEQLQIAHEYNNALSSGVRLDANANVPTGDGVSSDDSLIYNDMLKASSNGLMARLRIPSIDVDLPIYHGTSDPVLLRGVGHLEGSHLPIGGIDTHSVLTAHRGLANATMFTNLDDVKVGDTFTIEVFGEVLTYQVNETKVVDPGDTDTLRAVPGKDLVTLITCTPLGINTHRILVTGERITPTPIKDIAEMGSAPTIPGFPWWVVWYGTGLALIGGFVWRAGLTDSKQRAPRSARLSASAESA
ncbi:class C sortase [Jonesiaceae bacterium BS-20]|uniref:Class C sortase n=1 Tax=Jonesiaceae bacterium BS-20 TaxID=3120821 RepID=A0AAU7DZ51_9MICO